MRKVLQHDALHTRRFERLEPAHDLVDGAGDPLRSRVLQERLAVGGTSLRGEGAGSAEQRVAILADHRARHQ